MLNLGAVWISLRPSTPYFWGARNFFLPSMEGGMGVSCYNWACAYIPGWRKNILGNQMGVGSHIVQVIIPVPFLVVFHPKMLYWQKMTGAVFSDKSVSWVCIETIFWSIGIGWIFRLSLNNTIAPKLPAKGFLIQCCILSHYCSARRLSRFSTGRRGIKCK